MAKLQGGTRIYGNATIDTTLYAGNVSISPNILIGEGNITFVGSGNITFGDDTSLDTTSNIIFKRNPPSSSLGDVGDTIGMIAGDSSWFYWCSDSYTGNNAAIWRRTGANGNNNW